MKKGFIRGYVFLIKEVWMDGCGATWKHVFVVTKKRFFGKW